MNCPICTVIFVSKIIKEDNYKTWRKLSIEIFQFFNIFLTLYVSHLETDIKLMMRIKILFSAYDEFFHIYNI